MKKLLPVVAIALAGCSGAAVTESAPIPARVHELKVVRLVISVDDREASSAVGYFRATLISELCKRERFVKFLSALDAGEPELKVTVLLSGIYKVSTLERVILGACPGAAKLKATVSLSDPKSKDDLGTFTVHGESSCYGTTLEGIEATAIGVAEQLSRRP